MRYGIVAHGGAGAPSSMEDGCRSACLAGMDLLDEGADALEAVAEAVRVLEDDGRFNAGRGSALRLDGRTVEMDAAVMDSAGAMGSVMAVRGVKNPVLAARAVTDTPHIILAGEGAANFALAKGLLPFGRPSEPAVKRHEKILSLIREGKLGEYDPRWRDKQIKELWNFPVPCRDVLPCDTVGAVALDRRGVMAAAVSTGGAVPMLLGRVGDSPIPGCGFWAGPACAVTATGLGEELIRRLFCKTVYDRVSVGDDLKEACDRAIAALPHQVTAGVIAISPGGHAVAANRDMAHHVMIKEA